jgi:hypothetical protein
VTERERVLVLVRRARALLDALRVAKSASRGLLAGAAGAMVLLACGKVLAWHGAGAWAWAMVAAGACSGAIVALARPRIGVAAAALFLDRGLATHERIATLATCPAGPFTDRVASELGGARAVPRLPVPREAALAPVALFGVLALGLVPAAGATQPGEDAAGYAASAPARPAADGRGDVPVPELPDETIARLARGGAPAPAEVARMQAALDRDAHRPEDRRAAADDLARAAEGDAEAARRVAARLEAARGGRVAGDAFAEGDATPVAPDAPPEGAALQVTAYPEAAAFLGAYRRALLEEDE